jgi:hypothetical protein
LVVVKYNYNADIYNPDYYCLGVRTPSDTRQGGRGRCNIFIPTEERFKWQDPVNDFDAFYTLPSTIDQKTAVFGSSTRSDWENTWTNKKDGMNPNAGPGQNGVPNDRQLSDYPNPASTTSLLCYPSFLSFKSFTVGE